MLGLRGARQSDHYAPASRTREELVPVEWLIASRLFLLDASESCCRQMPGCDRKSPCLCSGLVLGERRLNAQRVRCNRGG